MSTIALELSKKEKDDQSMGKLFKELVGEEINGLPSLPPELQPKKRTVEPSSNLSSATTTLESQGSAAALQVVTKSSSDEPATKEIKVANVKKQLRRANRLLFYGAPPAITIGTWQPAQEHVIVASTPMAQSNLKP